ncbi:MAG: CHC2 zinc finger domain-containing protein [Thiomonas sp.]|uniref:CHC2 zinc finger domain-containing protein n=1 Tax=Thiomonas sp. TaxID=2047785 RepID=UPI002A3598CA|nr:CHC2 zinc finger domain-containing protein [Thiomonas sp.]MDY0331630.1 CHC2 zinc finger domain-containing protein [Thiomonas sp.]
MIAARRPAQRFDRARLPDPLAYYAAELGFISSGGVWRSALCPFHKDSHPSLRVNTQTGAFKCMSCGAHGGDVLDFQMQRYGLPFAAAAKAVGAWNEGHHV